MDAEVIVVGAGPGGSSAAYHLARLGRRVLLLDRQRFPRDKSCGDGLTRTAVGLLAAMGVLDRLGRPQAIRGVRVLMRGKGQRDFEYPRDLPPPQGGLVVPRLDLDEALCRHAVAAGAELWEEALARRLLYTGGVVTGVEILHQGETRRLRARVVVAADGAASRLARQAGLTDSPASAGTAIRGYYRDIVGLTEMLEIYTPLLDPTDRYLLPSYGWVFPTGPDSANVGVGLFQRERGANVRALFERFLEALGREDPRFAHARLCGRWQGAPLRFDFAPERATAPGLALVGDAAGMISPFTGEGISYALGAGKLAAEVIDRQLRGANGDVPDLSEYARTLQAHYTGHFEAGRHSARRYLLVWHVLESTFHNERPLFDLCRQAALFPEGIGDSYTSSFLDDVGPLIERPGLPLRPDLLAVGELLIDTVRRDWPFLARLSAADQQDPGIPFRPALLLLLASYLARPKRPGIILVAAAVELGYLAALAQLSVEEEPVELTGGDGTRPANWGNMFALMVGNFLLIKAHELSARVGADVSRAIAEALARAAEGRVRELRNAFNLDLQEAEHLDILTRKTATLFELPCRLGAVLSGASAAQAEALATYGRHVGLAFQLADDVLAATGRASRLGKATGADLREGVYSLPVLRLLRRQDGRGERLRALLARRTPGADEARAMWALVRESGEADGALVVAHAQARQARDALRAWPDGPVLQSLGRLAEFAVARALPGTSPGAGRRGPDPGQSIR